MKLQEGRGLGSLVFKYNNDKPAEKIKLRRKSKMDKKQIDFASEELRLKYIMQITFFVTLSISFILSVGYNFNVNMFDHINNEMQYPLILFYIVLGALFVFMHIRIRKQLQTKHYFEYRRTKKS